MSDTVSFLDSETGKEIEFYVVEETKINGFNYLLVTESEDDDSEAYILKEIKEESGDIILEMVDDDDEIDYIGRIFAEKLDDIDLLR